MKARRTRFVPGRWAPACMWVAFLAGCERGVPENPTYSRHVAAILSEKCVSCHHAGGAAPFSLATYEETRDKGTLIANAVQTRRMPPWLPRSSDYAFAGDPSLSEREIETITRWVERGTPRGEGAPASAPRVAHDQWQLGQPDLVLEMRDAYTLRTGNHDVFRNFVLAVPTQQTRYVRAVELQPGSASVVHHAVMRVDTTNTSRQQDERDAEPGFDGMFSPEAAQVPTGFFVGWTPGRQPKPNPPGLAWAVEPGTDLVLQMHFRPHAGADSIRAKVGLYFADAPPQRTPVLLRLGSQTIDIAPAQSDYTVTDSLRLPVDVELLGLYPHAHYVAKGMDVRAHLPNGDVRRLLDIADWDFNWQDEYAFAEPVVLPAGTTLRLRYSYDNSTANPQNPHAPPRRVVYGPNSTDEMAELWIQALPRSANDLAALQREVARKAARDRVQGWEHLIRLNPDDAVAHASLAAFYQRLNDTDRAIKHYQEAIRAQPDFASAHYNLGLVLEVKGDLRAAAEHYRAALRSRADHAGTHNNLGNVLKALGQRNDAEVHFRRAIGLAPDQAEAHNNLGTLLWEDASSAEAIEHYRHAIAAQPNAAAAHFNLALALASLARNAEADQAFQAGLRLQPNAVEAIVAMAWLLSTHPDFRVRRPPLSLQLATRAAQLYGRPHVRILDVLAAAEAASGRFDRAAAFAREAEQLASGARQTEQASRIRNRLQLYLQRQPYIEQK